MLYKKKKNNINKLRQRVKPHIGIIETTMMYHSTKDLKDRLVSVIYKVKNSPNLELTIIKVFTVFVEEPTRHLVLIRYYEDFQEFYNRASICAALVYLSSCINTVCIIDKGLLA